MKNIIVQPLTPDPILSKIPSVAYCYPPQWVQYNTWLLLCSCKICLYQRMVKTQVETESGLYKIDESFSFFSLPHWSFRDIFFQLYLDCGSLDLVSFQCMPPLLFYWLAFIIFTIFYLITYEKSWRPLAEERCFSTCSFFTLLLMKFGWRMSYLSGPFDFVNPYYYYVLIQLVIWKFHFAEKEYARHPGQKHFS